MSTRAEKNDPRLVPGALLRRSWGATMRRNEFYQVIAVKGNTVELGCPETKAEGTGFDAGNEWITARNPNPKLVRYAKFTANGLKICKELASIDWKGTAQEKRVDGWMDSLFFQEIGEKESFYGD